MTRLIRVLGVSTFLFACTSAQVEEELNPFIGEWKLDLGRSDLTGDVITFEETDSGMIRQTLVDESWEFQIDGKEYPGPFGDRTVSWTQSGERKWEEVYRIDGKLMWTRTRELSEDGQTMNWVQTGTKPNGESFRDTGSNKRLMGSEGLIGKWRNTEVKAGSAEVMIITAFGNDGITIENPAYGISCDGTFDGKEHECRGPNVPEGLTISLTRTGPNELSDSTKIKSRNWQSGTMTVSEDGLTLTAVSLLKGADKPLTLVYQKQP